MHKHAVKLSNSVAISPSSDQLIPLSARAVHEEMFVNTEASRVPLGYRPM